MVCSGCGELAVHLDHAAERFEGSTPDLRKPGLADVVRLGNRALRITLEVNTVDDRPVAGHKAVDVRPQAVAGDGGNNVVFEGEVIGDIEGLGVRVVVVE